MRRDLFEKLYWWKRYILQEKVSKDELKILSGLQDGSSTRPLLDGIINDCLNSGQLDVQTWPVFRLPACNRLVIISTGNPRLCLFQRTKEPFLGCLCPVSSSVRFPSYAITVKAWLQNKLALGLSDVAF